MKSHYLNVKLFVFSLLVPWSEMRHSIPQPPKSIKNNEVGLWSMGDCILAKFSMKLFVPLESLENAVNDILEIEVPSTANAMKDDKEHHCSNNTKRDQKLTLFWEKRISNVAPKTLYNTITITFTESIEKHNYGISRIRGEFELNDELLYKKEILKHQRHQNKHLLTLDSEPWYHYAKTDQMMFISPNNRSFSCKVGINVHLSAKLKQGSQEVNLNGNKNASLHAGDFEFDAFRNITDKSKTNQFRTHVYCDYHGASDVIPTISIPLVIMISMCIIFAILFAFGLLKSRKHNTPYDTFE